ncbi:flagellin lysine-N-methylase [Clostridium senegalense]|uniref:Lysine-N-methylase n=1 Tax=Clostridium senegalense TaxID=1465809 RepID=A0A6M0H568_9CLOT|nr:flagellin lysine-N-methylase [Clostridium senegalense]NEU05855.1 hypothetical protein [Clostridium senegalense]
MSKKIILTPSYMKKFKCIGGECTDSCCIGWKVSIDKKSYQSYRSCKDKKLKEKLDECVKRDRKSVNDGAYAKIVLNEEKRCPFLNKENLCDVYLNMGEKYMSHVCTTYPRIYNEVNGVLEKSLTLSCPEAARIILDNEDFMSFDEVFYKNEKFIKQMTVNSNKNNISNYLEKYFWELRIIAISIIQSRIYSIDERMVVLGLLCDEVNNAMKSGKGNDIPIIVEKYTSRIASDIYKEYLKNIPLNIDLKVKLIRSIEGLKLIKCSNSKFLDFIAKSLFGIGCVSDASNEDIKDKYNIAKEKYDNILENKYSYILENYLVNHLFKNSFPLNKRNNIFEEYILLCVYYSIIKFSLIGLSSEKELTKEEIIEFIQVFSKAVEHDKDYIKDLNKRFKEDDLNTMAYMAILIKG